MADRRDALKIIGAVGSTCAFPFTSDELYGQHVHPAPETGPPKPAAPRFFSQKELALVGRIADLIIPETDTPGATGAGVPLYIDLVVHANPQHQPLYREGLAWLARTVEEQFHRPFLELTEQEQIDLLSPLSEAVDSDRVETAEQRFFAAVKSMTADGYYTSRIGLVEELGYSGNQALVEFGACEDEK